MTQQNFLTFIYDNVVHDLQISTYRSHILQHCSSSNNTKLMPESRNYRET